MIIVNHPVDHQSDKEMFIFSMFLLYYNHLIEFSLKHFGCRMNSII